MYFADNSYRAANEGAVSVHRNEVEAGTACPLIYADNAATTPVSESVLNAMLPYMTERFGNPSSIYRLGREARRAVETARSDIAEVFGCKPKEIFFTSCGSESDSWAIKQAVPANEAGKNHIITTAIEHHAILRACEQLAKQGFEITYLPVSADGYVTSEQVARAIRDNTALVSVMYANNEIGTIMPIPEIAAVCHERGVLFHTDAVQAVGNLPINVQVVPAPYRGDVLAGHNICGSVTDASSKTDISKQGIDMMSISGHKIHAPKGIGALYIRSGINLPSLICGGGQERGMRGGTENVAAIVGLAQAVKDACADIPAKQKRISAIRDRIIDGILEQVPDCRLNGGRERRLAGNINFSFAGVESETLLLMLDMKGICASGGSACASGSLDPSHVLLALGLPRELAQGSLRLSIADPISEADADYIVKSVAEIVKKIRRTG